MFQNFYIVIFSLVVLGIPDSNGQCTFDMTKSSRTTPLFIQDCKKDGNDAFFMPTTSSPKLTFTKGTNVNLQCPGSYLTDSKNVNLGPSVKATCDRSDNFVINGKTYSIVKLQCKSNVKLVAKKSTGSCPSKCTSIGIGWDIKDNTADKFLKQIEICFDSTKVNTVWAKYSLSKYLSGQITGYNRADFSKDNYPLNDINDLYERVKEQSTINSLLGITSSANKDDYVTTSGGNKFLARGHLGMKTEFVHGWQQDATMHYYNVVPQWQTLNNAKWKSLEKNCKDLAASRKIDLDVYTGSFGIDTLPHFTRKTPVYLYLKSPQVPVPKYMWKALYNKSTKEGVVVVAINSPYNDVKPADKFCTDICHKLTWLTITERDNKLKGVLFCCSLTDFKKTVSDFPISSTKLLM